MTEPVIVIDQLVKSYGSQKVLRSVSLSIPPGQTLALLGRNGAGKTTMIRILMGVLPADSGVCRLRGADPAVDPLKVRRNVGYLAEDQIMYGWMTRFELCRFLAPFYRRQAVGRRGGI
jgi:ABC-2 type transport system ATP-binding protein